MIVKYNYLPQEFNNTQKIFKDWKKLIKSSEFTLGPFVEKFEKICILYKFNFVLQLTMEQML